MKQKKKNEIITQLCESCKKWVNQMSLVWDLEEDRLVCKECYKRGKDND